MTARRGQPGVPASPFGVAEVVRLRAALLRLYGADGEFMAALQAFAASPAREDRLAAYGLAAQFGLDRIGPDLLAWTDEDTPDDLKRAALWAAHVGLNAVADFAAESQAWTGPFPLTVGVGYVEPQLGERVAVEPVFDRQGSQVAVYEVWRPIVRVAFTDKWHPGHEARGVASKRILGRARAAIRAELDRLENEAAEAGYSWSDSTTNETRDLDWLFWHLRYRMSYPEIAKKARDYDAEGVVKAVRAVALRAGVRLRVRTVRPTA